MKTKLLQKGFTLIELLLVIAILGILSAGLLVILNPVSKIHQANDSNVKGDVNTVAQALTGYFTDQTYQAYPLFANFTKDNTNDLVKSKQLKSLPPTVLNASSILNCTNLASGSTGVCYTDATGSNSNTCGTGAAGAPVACEAVFAGKLSDGKWWCWDSVNGAPSEQAYDTIKAKAAADPPTCK